MSKATTTKFNAGTPILSMEQCVQLLCAPYATKRSIVIEGDTGSGKTWLGKEVSKRTGKRLVYFDCGAKSIEDLSVPWPTEINGTRVVMSVPHEEFGIQFNEPIVLMFDEIGKNRSLFPGVTRVLQERTIGNTPLHPETIIFGSTNLGVENFGDTLPGFVRSRINLLRMRKPNAEEWMQWGANNNIVPALLAAVHEFPQMLESFTDVEDPKDNPYIYDPRDSSRTAFVTNRSLHHLSDLLHDRDMLGDDIVVNAAMGIVGAKAAQDIMTMVTLGDTLPKYHEIVAAPEKVKVPVGVGAQIMSALTCMQRVEATDFPDVFKYVQRLPMEIQALFANQLMKAPSKSVWVARQQSFTDFARKNFNLFTQ